MSSTQALILDYFQSWQVGDFELFANTLADDVELRGTFSVSGKTQLVAAVEAGNPWEDVTLIDSSFDATGGTIVYTATDKTNGKPQQVAELIRVVDGKISEVTIVWSQGKLPVSSTDLPTESQVFQPFFPDVPNGPALNVLWGSLEGQESGFLLKVPSGFQSPTHKHSAAYRGIVLSGTIRNGADIGTAPDLTSGSYWSQEAGADHVTGCVSAEPCLSLVIYTGPFDNILAE